MDFLSQLKNLHCHFCDKILHQISHMYIGTLVKGTLETFFNYFSKYYCLIFHQNNNCFFDQYDPHAGGLGRLMCFPLVILMNRLNETESAV